MMWELSPHTDREKRGRINEGWKKIINYFEFSHQFPIPCFYITARRIFTHTKNFFQERWEKIESSKSHRKNLSKTFSLPSHSLIHLFSFHPTGHDNGWWRTSALIHNSSGNNRWRCKWQCPRVWSEDLQCRGAFECEIKSKALPGEWR